MMHHVLPLYLSHARQVLDRNTKDKFMNRVKLIKKVIDKLTSEDGKKVDYWDTDLHCFCLRLRGKTKVYYVAKRLHGKMVWTKLGTHGQITPDQARRMAKETLGDITKGINPNKEKAKARDIGVTLQQAFDAYLAAKPDLKPNTVSTYKILINAHLSKWLNRPLEDITEDMIAKRHTEIATESGHSGANNTMRTFRLIYNYAKARLNKSLPDNPVKTLSDVDQWYKIKRRQTVIKEYQLPDWWTTVLNLSNPYVRDYLLLTILTGMREKEGLSLKWSDIVMKGKCFTIRETKNGNPHTLPMSDYILDIFIRLYNLRLNDYVFPSTIKTDSHIVEVNRQVRSVCSTSGVSFCLHDLRRTYSTIAQAVVPHIVLKKLLNHATDDDVTAGYISLDTDNLRPYQQSVTNAILKVSGISKEHSERKVIPIRNFIEKG